MSIEEVSLFVKRVCRYQSPDGDACEITKIEQDGKNYVNLKWENGQEATVDLQMVFDMNDFFREGPPGLASTPVMPVPQVEDHTTADTPSQKIERSVSESMKKHDGETRPFESFAPTPSGTREEAQMNRAGVDQAVATNPAGETPDEWQIKEGQGGEQWKDEVADRQKNKLQLQLRKGRTGKEVRKKPRPDEII